MRRLKTKITFIFHAIFFSIYLNSKLAADVVGLKISSLSCCRCGPGLWVPTLTTYLLVCTVVCMQIVLLFGNCSTKNKNNNNCDYLKWFVVAGTPTRKYKIISGFYCLQQNMCVYFLEYIKLWELQEILTFIRVFWSVSI